MGRPKKYATEEERKAVRKEYNAAYDAAHKEEEKARRKAYYEAHKEEIKARIASYRFSNKEEIKARRKAHYAAHKEGLKSRQREYVAAHPENHLLNAYRKEDEKRGRDNDLTLEYVRNMIYKQCHYCGSMAESGHNGLDRVDNNLGHLQSNCVPCCPTCNKKKRTKDYEVFMKEIQDNV